MLTLLSTYHLLKNHRPVIFTLLGFSLMTANIAEATQRENGCKTQKKGGFFTLSANQIIKNTSQKNKDHQPTLTNSLDDSPLNTQGITEAESIKIVAGKILLTTHPAKTCK